MGSSRLPGKSMMDLAGAPLVGRILERVKRCLRVDDIILAIPDSIENNPLAKLGKEYGVNVFAGSENDLVDRYYQASLLANAEYVVRLPADNATPEPSEIDRIIEHHLMLGRRGFSSNLSVINDSGYPDGIGAEIFDFSLLKEARDQPPNAIQREHVHRNFFNYETQTAVNEKWCPISTTACPEEFRRPDLVLDVNTMEQYEFMRELYEYLYQVNKNFHINDIIRWFDTVYQNKTDA